MKERRGLGETRRGGRMMSQGVEDSCTWFIGLVLQGEMLVLWMGQRPLVWVTPKQQNPRVKNK